MSQPPRRPSRPARTPTSRPRRVAGQSRVGGPADEPVDDSTDEPTDGPTDEARDEAGDETSDAPVVDLAKATPATATAATAYDDDDGGSDAPGRTRSPLVALVVVIVLLLGLGAAEVVYLATADDGGEAASGQVTPERPVQVSDLTVRSVVDQAAKAAGLILSASSADYDAQVDEATATMTDPFAEDYRATKADVKEQFVAQQTEVSIEISAQGVVTADADQVVALLFLTQTTQKGAQGNVTPVQYRVTVTMVDTEDGWLVSALEAL